MLRTMFGVGWHYIAHKFINSKEVFTFPTTLSTNSMRTRGIIVN